MADDVVERVTDELLADLIRQGERNAGASARGSAFLSIFRELQERRRSPSPDAVDQHAIWAARFLVDAYAKRRPTDDAEPYALIVARALLALSPPVEGE